jgi:hypothetical protein
VTATFRITFRAEPRVGLAPERRLKHLLKIAGRTFGLRCVRLEGVDDTQTQEPDLNPKGPDMRFDDLFPSAFLKASDFDEGPRTLVVDKITRQELGDEMKPVVYFRNTSRGLVLNKVNGGALRGLYGSDTDGWLGQPVEAYSTTTEFGGKIVPCIRLRAPKSKSTAPRGPITFTASDEKAELSKALDGDDLPF